ncbi:carbon monoxide dehydrogenase [Streptomyces sp. AJS327]|uniref:SRPBCC family protein n=1 Tax=Streptomyces sp. AJS327 TaxID=2545265 RepID=UPI0015DFE597|nr:SRPBCC family protein [Streptomyces sp. AJS327]MBA0052367.1 carbon monoxide dehydrogenase [Streptomyces sp. AJS327]
MQLTNVVPVKAAPDEVFALINDVERVVSCMPGAALDGRDGDTWQGRVKVKVGPITAAYAGTVRFIEVDSAARRLRVQARGADAHGSGDAEAEASLEVAEAPGGAELRLTTDLVIRGKIAQFGKGAVATVSEKILQQFARNLGSLLDQDRAAAGAPANSAAPAGGAAAATAPAGAATATAPAERRPAAPLAAEGASELNGLSMIVGPALSKYGPVVGAFAFGLFEGWLLGRVLTREKHRCGGAR